MIGSAVNDNAILRGKCFFLYFYVGLVVKVSVICIATGKELPIKIQHEHGEF